MRKIKIENLKNDQIILVEINSDLFLRQVTEIVRVHKKESGTFQLMSVRSGAFLAKNFDQEIHWMTKIQMVKIKKEWIENGRWRDIRGHETALLAFYYLSEKKIQKLKKIAKEQKNKRENEIKSLQKQLVGFNSAMRRAGLE